MTMINITNITKKVNCIVVFDKTKEHILFCNRAKDPYKGLYNFVGGKVEPGETDDAAAYRELYEETGISHRMIRLFRFMDLTYYYQDFILELYVGQLTTDFTVIPEKNPLEWLPLTENFADASRFAGEQNIAHIVNVALKFPLEDYVATCRGESISIGVDGCRGGWITAVIEDGKLAVDRFKDIGEITAAHPDFTNMLIDMVIGLPESPEDIRPDSYAKKLLKQRASTIFPVPARTAVYETDESRQKAANIKALGKSLAKQTIAIIPKMRELDEYMCSHSEMQDKIFESHPEVCFAKLNGEVMFTRKSEYPGQMERIDVLSRYLKGISIPLIADKAAELHCNKDDIIDAICLAVTANLKSQGKTTVIPENPMRDSKGLLMQMTIPAVGQIEREKKHEY